MNPRSLLVLSAALSLGAASVHAHRVWILPAVTVLSGTDQWVSVDAAVSNNLFFPNHRPVQLAQVEVRDPEGAPVELQNATGGEIRSSFELHLQKQGTYVVSLKPSSGRRPMGSGPGGPGGQGGQGGAKAVQPTLFGSYEVDGKVERWRGTPESLVAEGMAAKPGFKLRESGSRSVVTFVTLGKPTTATLKPTGKGLEVDYLSHPNDLFAGEPATFRFLLDGQPAANTEVTLIRGDDRYRDDEGALTLKADADGKVKIDWPMPGRYWLEATASVASTLHGAASEKSFTYIAIYEVLPN